MFSGTITDVPKDSSNSCCEVNAFNNVFLGDYGLFNLKAGLLSNLANASAVIFLH